MYCPSNIHTSVLYRSPQSFCENDEWMPVAMIISLIQHCQDFVVRFGEEQYNLLVFAFAWRNPMNSLNVSHNLTKLGIASCFFTFIGWFFLITNLAARVKGEPVLYRLLGHMGTTTCNYCEEVAKYGIIWLDFYSTYRPDCYHSDISKKKLAKEPTTWTKNRVQNNP